MPDMHLLITKSTLTRAISDLSDKRKDLVYLKILSANVAAVNAKLSAIDDVNWISSDSITLKEGAIDDGILLPKKAGT